MVNVYNNNTITFHISFLFRFTSLKSGSIPFIIVPPEVLNNKKQRDMLMQLKGPIKYICIDKVYAYFTYMVNVYNNNRITVHISFLFRFKSPDMFQYQLSLHYRKFLTKRSRERERETY